MISLFRPAVPRSALRHIEEVLESGYLADGEVTREFERRFADYIGNPRVVACAEVSSGLWLALHIAGVRPGDDVVSTPMTCLSLNQPVLNLFARVIWCDVDPMTGNLSTAALRAALTDRTKAVLVPHWGGDPADLAGIRAIAAERGIRVIEDAGEALGAEYQGKKIGAEGDIAVFSFHAIRHLTTGEGGAVIFNRDEDRERGRWLKRYGIHQPGFRAADGEIDPASDIAEAGINSYLTNIAAAIGLAQFPELEERLAKRRANGDRLRAALADVPGVESVRILPEARSACWVHTLLVERRDDLLRALKERGVQASRLHHRNDAYSCFSSSPRTRLPGVDVFAARSLVLPCGWWLSEEEIERIVAAVRRGW